MLSSIPMSSTLSEDLRSLKIPEGGEISFHELLQRGGDNGLLLLIILLNAPFLLPIPIPNLSTPFGILILFIGAKLIWGIPRHLPEFIGKRILSDKVLNSILDKTVQGAQKIEKFIHPRYPALIEHRFFLSLNYLLIMGMAFILTLPLVVPFTNFFPAWTIILIALGILEKDGILIVIGYLSTLLTMLYFYLIYIFGTAVISWGKELISRF